MTSASTGTSSAGHLNSVSSQRCFRTHVFTRVVFLHLAVTFVGHLLIFLPRLAQEQTEQKKDLSAVTTSNSQGSTTGEQETKQRRK